MMNPIEILNTLKKYNIKDINDLPKDFPFKTERIKASILNWKYDFEEYSNQITEIEKDIFYNKNDNITDLKNAYIYDVLDESDITSYYIVFIDQDGNLRNVAIYDPEILGIIKYYKKHKDIKNDLILFINQSYELERDLE